MNQKLTIGFFLFGCVIIIATVLAYNRIEKLEDIIIAQDETIQLQQQAIMMQKLENQILKNSFSIRLKKRNRDRMYTK